MQTSHPQAPGRLLLVAAVAITLSACGESDDAAGSTTPTTPAPTTEATAATTAAATTPTEPSTTDTVSETTAASPPTTVASTGVPAGDVDTTAGVEAALWGDNVTITIGDGSFQFVSNGIPNHELSDQYLVPGGEFTPPVDESEVTAYDSAEVVTETPLDVTIPMNPVYSDTVTETNLGMIGVIISGAQQFNDYEDPDRSFIAVNDNFSIDGVPFVDSCNGHPLALNVGGGNYHYHGVPYCITDDIDTEGQHSTILGFLLDGFPIYGPQDVDGCIVTGDDLDECNGHFGPTPEFPNGIYHYHIKEDQSPYTPDCYHGVVETTTAEGGGAPEGGPPAGGAAPDFTDAAATLGVTVEELEAALGQPPFDLVAAAETLGVTAEELEAALPPPPGGGG